MHRSNQSNVLRTLAAEATHRGTPLLGNNFFSSPFCIVSLNGKKSQQLITILYIKVSLRPNCSTVETQKKTRFACQEYLYEDTPSGNDVASGWYDDFMELKWIVAASSEVRLNGKYHVISFLVASILLVVFQLDFPCDSIFPDYLLMSLFFCQSIEIIITKFQSTKLIYTCSNGSNIICTSIDRKTSYENKSKKNYIEV